MYFCKIFSLTVRPSSSGVQYGWPFKWLTLYVDLWNFERNIPFLLAASNISLASYERVRSSYFMGSFIPLTWYGPYRRYRASKNFTRSWFASKTDKSITPMITILCFFSSWFFRSHSTFEIDQTIIILKTVLIFGRFQFFWHSVFSGSTDRHDASGRPIGPNRSRIYSDLVRS